MHRTTRHTYTKNVFNYTQNEGVVNVQAQRDDMMISKHYHY
jgi:hypothetical protein